ncbi:hypothetical protein [Ensifer aridi]|uniref:hypothetical protein n=1 Tax=Ensifer aridi TaxID=1708715 RepID=UPI00111C15A9|nr:hypothetical protein [Ensifer aridi]
MTMKIYALFDVAGRASGFWTDDLYPPIDLDGEVFPNPAIPAVAAEISPENHRRLIEYPDAWRWQNGALTAFEPPPPTPEEARAVMPPLTARQLRLGLLNAGISPSQVTATIDGMAAGPDKDKAQVEWEYATIFNRTHPLVGTVGAALALSEQQIDEMWTAAIVL